MSLNHGANVATAVDTTIDYLKNPNFRDAFRQSPNEALQAIGVDPNHIPGSFMEMLMTLSDEEITVLGHIRSKLADREIAVLQDHVTGNGIF